MSKDQRGIKRECESCGKKFYDLGRDPVICPYCQAPYLLVKPKPKAEVKEEAPAPAAKPEPEPEKPAAPAVDPEPEFVSLEEAAEEELDEDAKLADLGDDEEDIPPDDTEDVFLEEEEEDPESDVTGIIGGPIDPKE